MVVQEKTRQFARPVDELAEAREHRYFERPTVGDRSRIKLVSKSSTARSPFGLLSFRNSTWCNQTRLVENPVSVARTPVLWIVVRVAPTPPAQATLPRSPSSPSPPSKLSQGRPDPYRKLVSRRSTASVARPVKKSHQEWSSSYQAGSSGSGSDTSVDDDTDDGLEQSRGRPLTQQALESVARDTKHFQILTKRQESVHRPSHSDNSRHSSPAGLHERKTFARSRSPAVHLPSGAHFNGDAPPRTASPSLFKRQKAAYLLQFPQVRVLLPSTLSAHVRLPFASTRWRVTWDVRQAVETSILVSSIGFVANNIRTCAKEPFSPDMWIAIELSLLVIASIIYYLVTRLTWSKIKLPAVPSQANGHPNRPASPRIDNREGRRTLTLTPSNTLKIGVFGYVWMTVPKNYRDSADDGIFTGILVGPLTSSALLYLSLQASASAPPVNPLPRTWLIEAPRVHHMGALEALILSRRNLVSLATFCSTILIVHVCASWMTEARHRRKLQVPDGEVSSVPRKEGRRTYLYVLFTVSVSLWILCVRIAFSEMKIGIWQNLNYVEVVVSSLFFQFSLFMSIRMAHHGFTFGELGLVCFGATVLFMEMLNLTIARIWPTTTPFIKTFRLPTPLLVFQIALIPGSLMVGLLLSPLLYLSRHIAQRPVRRLRYPAEKQKHRRLLALGFYFGSVLIVGGLIGMWTRWCLVGRDPWLWALFWLLEGKKKWSRPALLAYWGALGSISVAGWNRQLARSRRYRPRGVGDLMHAPFESARSGSGMEHSDSSAPPTPAADSSGPLGLSFPNLPNLPNGAQMSNVATDLLDAADKHVPLLSLNARRKFFHALAVVMFLPGLAVDPAFTHLSFSAAFALFVFAEYVRYFALYPFGASVHLFMNEFLDQKDSGTAILSHFYLLIGCAGSVWFEGPSQLLQYTGILVLGVGDALASIVGKRLGRHRWVATSTKTLEGSAAFTVSIVACAWLMRVCGLTEHFSLARYAAVAALSAALEAFSVQNDNVVLPVYMWSMLVIGNA